MLTRYRVAWLEACSAAVFVVQLALSAFCLVPCLSSCLSSVRSHCVEL